MKKAKVQVKHKYLISVTYYHKGRSPESDAKIVQIVGKKGLSLTDKFNGRDFDWVVLRTKKTVKEAAEKLRKSRLVDFIRITDIRNGSETYFWRA